MTIGLLPIGFLTRKLCAISSNYDDFAMIEQYLPRSKSRERRKAPLIALHIPAAKGDVDVALQRMTPLSRQQ